MPLTAGNTKEEHATLYSQIVSNLERAWDIMMQISQVAARGFRR